jgi:hypothetical protein
MFQLAHTSGFQGIATTYLGTVANPNRCVIKTFNSLLC